MWELEVGQTVAPDQGLPETISPDGFDDPNTLAAFVDAVRWGAVTSADGNAFQAPFRSGANVEAYQLEPLRRALQSARTNLLLADDVGLGKTIEAGLVMQELLLRHRARSVVIVCPPSLSLKWRDEMREKFGLEFEIVNSELMAKVLRTHGPNANPFRLFPRVIVSMAWLPSLRAQRLLRAGVRRRAGRQQRAPVRVRRAHRGRGAPRRAREPDRRHRVPRLRGRQPADGRHQGAGRKVRAPAVPVRDPAQRLLRVVHRADGDDRRPPVQAGRQPGRARAARHRGPPPQGGPGRREGLPYPGAQDAGLHAVEGRGGEVRAARPDPRRERPAQRAGQVGRHRGDAVQEAVPVQPVVVRADPAALHRVRRRIGSRDRGRGPVLPGGPGQRAVRRGRGRHPAPRVHRPAAQQGLGPAGGRDGQGHRVADRLGP